MLGPKLFVLQELVNALPKDLGKNNAALPFLQELQDTVKETVQDTVQKAVQKTDEGEWIEMPFPTT